MPRLRNSSARFDRAVAEDGELLVSTCATLTSGRARMCLALAAVPLVLNDQEPCRKWPSIALIRGCPAAVTVATETTTPRIRAAAGP